jgi:hypothetical protein
LCRPSSAEVSRRIRINRDLPEIATVSAGLAWRVPENGDLSDIETVKVATVVPENELSGSEVVAGSSVMPVGMGGGGGSTANTVIVKFAESLNCVFIPFARIRTE